MVTRDKITGMFLGIAIGDALGMPVETLTGDEIQARHSRITTMVKPGDDHKWYAGKPAGTTTDDTQLSLIVAESLIACKEFDMNDMARRHVEAWKENTHGWGGSTREAVKRLANGVHWSESGKTTKKNRGRGNGIPMKIAPLGAWRATLPKDIGLLKKYVFAEKELAEMTHLTNVACVSGRVHSYTIRVCVKDALFKNINSTKKHLMLLAFSTIVAKNTEEANGSETQREISKRLEEIGAWTDNNKIKQLSVKEICAHFNGGSFDVVDSLGFTYAMFFRNPTSIETLYDTVSAGGDTDTNGSMVGALLGAYNGASIFPEHLINGLVDKEKIFDVAERFCNTFEVKE